MKIMKDHYNLNEGCLAPEGGEYERPFKKRKSGRSDCTVQFLPNELVLEIFNFLGCQQATLRLLSVCKQFNEVGSDYPPVRLLLIVKERQEGAYADFFRLPESSEPVTPLLQNQCAAMITSLDKEYRGIQEWLELASIMPSLRSNSFAELIENNRYLFKSLVKSNGLMLKYLGSRLKRDLPILQSGVQSNKLALEFVPNDLKIKIQETIFRDICLYQMEERRAEGSSREQPQWMAQYFEPTKDVFEEIEQWINEPFN